MADLAAAVARRPVDGDRSFDRLEDDASTGSGSLLRRGFRRRSGRAGTLARRAGPDRRAAVIIRPGPRSATPTDGPSGPTWSAPPVPRLVQGSVRRWFALAFLDRDLATATAPPAFAAGRGSVRLCAASAGRWPPSTSGSARRDQPPMLARPANPTRPPDHPRPRDCCRRARRPLRRHRAGRPPPPAEQPAAVADPLTRSSSSDRLRPGEGPGSRRRRSQRSTTPGWPSVAKCSAMPTSTGPRRRPTSSPPSSRRCSPLRLGLDLDPSRPAPSPPVPRPRHRTGRP